MNILPKMDPVPFTKDGITYCAEYVVREKLVREYDDFESKEFFIDIRVTKKGIVDGFVERFDPDIDCPISVDRLFVDSKTGYLMAECSIWVSDVESSGFSPDGLYYICFEQERRFFSKEPPEQCPCPHGNNRSYCPSCITFVD